jgi:hypothetical protein
LKRTLEINDEEGEVANVELIHRQLIEGAKYGKMDGIT